MVALFQKAIHLESGKGVCGLERGDDAFPFCEPAERFKRLVVGRGDVLDAARVFEERVLCADSRVVEPC